MLFKIASHLKKTPSEVLALSSASDFPAWEYILRESWNEPDLHCHYMAQICYRLYTIEVRLLGVMGGGEPLTFDKFLMKFTYEVKESKKATPLYDELGNKIIDQKEVKQLEKMLFGMVGLKADGTPLPKNPKIKRVIPRPDPSKRPSVKSGRAPMVRKPKRK